MPPGGPLRLPSEWDDRLRRMLGVSAIAHVLVFAAVVLLAGHVASRPLPMVAYTVEITDPNALGGRLPPGAPGADLSGGPSHAPTPEPKGEQAAAPKPPAPPPEEAKPEPKTEPPVQLAEKPKPVEPPAVAKPEPPKPQAAKPEAAKPEPAKPEPKKAEPAKPEAKKPEVAKATPKPESKPEAKPAAKPDAAKPDAAKAVAGKASGQEDAPPRDAYAAIAEKWKSRAAGGGLGGSDSGSGPVGTGGDGKGGGGQLVGVEFLAYRQQVINTIKAQWTNVIVRPGLVAAVKFGIASDGSVSDVTLSQSSGNPAYDASALRAVQHVGQLPPPPTRYVNEFREFVIEFHSEEHGGEGAG